MKKNNKLLIIVLVLIIIGVGVSFAYFLLGTTITGDGGLNSGTAARLIKVVFNAGDDENVNLPQLNPGMTATKNFSVKITPGSKGENTATYSIFLDIKTNTFEYCTDSNYNAVDNDCKKNEEELKYVLKEDGQQIATGDLTGEIGKIRLAKVTKTVNEETTYNYTLEITFVDTNKGQNHNKDKEFKAKLGVEFASEIDPSPAEETLAKMGVEPSEEEIGAITGPSCGQEKCFDGATVDSMQQNGLYYAGEDDDGPTYVYRGTVTNNWVKFGQTKNNEDIWWRIIRINGDGTIRMIFSGTTTGNSTPSATGTTTQISTSAYNTNYNDNTYVGYYYGSTGGTSYDNTHSNSNPSTIATAVNNWFSTQTKLNQEPYRSQIDDNAGFCNDREINTTSNWWTSEGSSNKGTGQVVTAYGPFPRFLTTGNSWRTDKNEPTLKCKQKEKDLYTLKDKATQGNKKLDYPVGLITADEVVFAGGYGGQNNTSYWLYTNQYYWTMSPWGMTTDHWAYVFYVNANGYLDWSNACNTYGVRPVINLKPDKVTAASLDRADVGTTANPYIVVE